jgi:hypothetical protein
MRSYANINASMQEKSRLIGKYLFMRNQTHFHRKIREISNFHHDYDLVVEMIIF